MIVVFAACSPHSNLPVSRQQVKKEEPLFTLRFAGDMILTVSIDHYVKKYSISYPLRRLNSWLQGADYTVVNLESCFTLRGTRYRNKKYTFRAPPFHMQMLQDAGVDAVSLANNHLLDFGQVGMDDTLATLQRYRIESYGAGTNLGEALRPLKTVLHGVPLYLLGGCTIRPADFYAGAQRPGTAPLDTARLTAIIRRLKKKRCLVLVTPHWGYEKRALPNPRQIKAARALIDAGADAVIGHHPHVPQSVELYKGRPVIYSLGNCLVGYYNTAYRNNLGVTLHCRGNRLIKVVFDSFAGKNLQSGFQPYPVTGPAGVRDMRYLKWISRPFKTGFRISAQGRAELLLNKPSGSAN